MKIIILRGLPGSGKTKWAKFYCSNHKAIRVSAYELGQQLDCSYLESIHARNMVMSGFLDKDFDIILDDMNLREDQMHEVQALWPSIEIQIVDFRGIALKDCINADAKKENPMGKDAIRALYEKWIRPSEKIKAVAFEFETFVAQYGSFFTPGLPRQRVVDGFLSFTQNGYAGIVYTTRTDEWINFINSWLGGHGISGIYIFAKAKDDDRSNNVIKRDMYETYMSGRFNVEFMLDYDPNTVDMLCRMGLKAEVVR